MSDELKPCKHCGGEARFQIFDTTCNVECRECGIGTRNVLLDNYQECIYKWNRSADEPQVIEKAESYKQEDKQEPLIINGDTREKLEADTFKFANSLLYMGEITDGEKRELIALLDRQAAITERELCDRCSPYATAKDYMDTIDSLATERDNWANCYDMAAKREQNLLSKIDSLTAERDSLRKQLAEKQRVCDVQRDSFLKLERENRELQDVCGELERTLENLRND